LVSNQPSSSPGQFSSLGLESPQEHKLLRFSKYIACFLMLALGICLSTVAAAQDDQEPSLVDLARSMKKAHQQPLPVITNENLGQMPELIKETEKRLSVEVVNPPVPSASPSAPQGPQVTCSLAFSADNKPAQLDPNPIQLDLPSSELVKLDGPALISDDTVQLSIYNGTAWNLREITIGLTLVKHDNQSAANYAGAHIMPASANSGSTLRRSDITLLYHLKGAAAPFSSAAFKEPLGINLNPDQEWHWAILQARGIPPR